ncbi:hypothetical protein [Chondromyces crocatus]|uniref:hypothetical protein n=1 Tax=Chondromyces crocatus TaxID=52 RepID=UPI0012E2BE76|nr:hypothetical protein [Chondromyces crocatus]
MSLRRLIAPLPLARFERDCWGHEAAVMRGPLERFGPLSGLAEAWPAETLVLAHRAPLTVCYPRPWLRGVRPQVAPTAVYPATEALVLHHLGASLYVRQLERFDPILNQALASLRGTAGSTTQVHGDVLLTGSSLPSEVPLPDGATFLVHLHGEQRWAVSGLVLDAAARSPSRARKQRTTEVRTQPGTVLYLPTNTARLTASTEGALTLVLSVPVQSAIEPVLVRAAELLLRVEALRAPALVPPTASGKRKALAAAARAMQSLPTALRDLHPHRLLAESRGRRFLRTKGVRARFRPLPGRTDMSLLTLSPRHGPSTEVTLDATFGQACAWILAQRTGFWEQDARLSLGIEVEALNGLLEALEQAGLLQERRG